MQIQGKIVQFLPEKSGTSAKGEWRTQQFVIETAEQYPKKICITAWNQLLDALAHCNIGDTVTCHINVESREYNGAWYSDVKMWKIESENSQERPDNEYSQAESDDLPF